MTRQEANKKIVELILIQIEKNPDLRFNQILSNLTINREMLDDRLEICGLMDLYSEEPQLTLKRVESELERQEKLKQN